MDGTDRTELHGFLVRIQFVCVFKFVLIRVLLSMLRVLIIALHAYTAIKRMRQRTSVGKFKLAAHRYAVGNSAGRYVVFSG